VNTALCSTSNSAAITEPSLHDLQQLQPGDVMGVSPPPSKADQTGEKYGPFMLYVKLERVPTNAAWRMLQLELQFPLQTRAERRKHPLFGPSLGQAFSSDQLDSFLPVLLLHVANTQPQLLAASDIKRYSWHSFRIALACALKSMDVPDSTIQAMCRWASPESLKLYARMSIGQYAELLQKAERATFDSVQATGLLRQTPFIDNDHKFIFNAALADLVDNHTPTPGDV
jgi:hypothetical protein